LILCVIIIPFLVLTAATQSIPSQTTRESAVTATADAVQGLMQTDATVSGRNLHTPFGFAAAFSMAVEANHAALTQIQWLNQKI
jgi:hypothetical protein